MAQPIVHWEIMGPDGGALNTFYADLFGWKGEAVPGFNDYYMITPESAGIGGAVGQGSDDSPSYLTMYIEVDSIDEHLEKINAAGGSTMVPRTVIPGTVVFAMFADPAGNMVGLVEPETPAVE